MWDSILYKEWRLFKTKAVGEKQKQEFNDMASEVLNKDKDINVGAQHK